MNNPAASYGVSKDYAGADHCEDQNNQYRHLATVLECTIEGCGFRENTRPAYFF